MEHQDKFYEHPGDSELAKQFKKASENIESHEFPSMEKVWSRVEEKLDRKVLTKQNNRWKKIAIAASALLLFTLAYQIFKPGPQIVLPKNEVATESAKAPETVKENPIVTTAAPNPIIKKEAPQILEQQLEKEPQIAAIQENTLKDSGAGDDQESETDMILKSKKATMTIPRHTRFQKGKAFESVAVQRKDESISGGYLESDKNPETKIIGNTQAPLVVIDGKAITGKEAAEINSVSDGVAKVDPNGDQEVVVLKEPLYIINGHYYSEEDLFGANPTSPYAPLNQQEIETILVLQGEKAIANYGKRGEKGVVVITTKDRKPADKNAVKTKTSKQKAK